MRNGLPCFRSSLRTFGSTEPHIITCDVDDDGGGGGGGGSDGYDASLREHEGGVC